MIIVFILAVVVVFVVLVKVWSKHKTPKVGSLALVTGGVKTGKTTFAVHLAIKNYRRAVFRWRVTSFFSFIVKKWKNQEKPLLYSNIPLTVPYVPVTQAMLRREVRFNYKSVILLSEASLIADSQLIKNLELNDQILLFCKLIAHETKGGMLVLDTQSISDLHYGFKRCLSEYFYIHHIFKWIPGFIIAWVQEQRYSDDGSVITAQVDDNEENLRWLIIPKKVWRVFDTYTYSAMTDDLPVIKNTRVGKRGHLKSLSIVSFRDRFFSTIVPKVSSVPSAKSSKIKFVKVGDNNEKKDN